MRIPWHRVVCKRLIYSAPDPLVLPQTVEPAPLRFSLLDWRSALLNRPPTPISQEFDSIWLLLPMFFGVVISALSRCFGVRELLGLVLGTIGAALLRKFPSSLVILFWIVSCSVLLALVEPAYRGVHRWIVLGGVRVNIALPLLTVGILVIKWVTQTRHRLLILLCCGSGLMVTNSYTLLIYLIWSTRSLWVRKHFSFYLVVVFVLLSACISLVSLDSNRYMRIVEFVQNKSYQSRQTRKALGTLTLLPSARAIHTHLPAATTDLALLHVTRTLGITVTLTYLLTFLPLMFFSVRSQSTYDPTIQLVFCALMCHIAVCLSILPAIGAPCPFISAGGTTWMSFSFLAFANIALEHKKKLNK